MKAIPLPAIRFHIDDRWQRLIALLLSILLIAAGLGFLLWVLFPAYFYMISLSAGGLLGIAGLFWLIVRFRRWWGGARIKAIAGIYATQPMEVKAMATYEQLQNWYTRQLGQMIVQHGIHVRATTARGPFTLTYTLNLTKDVASGLRNLQSLRLPLAQVLRANVRMANSPNGVLLEVELPRDAHATPAATALAGASRWPELPVGVDQFMKPVTVNPEEHGALYWIAPPRSGKTSSMRSTLAIAKRYAPDLQFVICALGVKLNKDWGVFGNVDGCLGLVSDPKEMEEALTWLVKQMNAGAPGPIFVILDDLTNLTSQANLTSQIDNLALAGPGLGYHLLVGTHGAGSKAATGGQLSRFGMTCKILYKAADNNSGAASAGRRNADTGIDQLSGYPGDAILDVHGRITRAATARINDVDIMALPAASHPQPRPWMKRKTVVVGATIPPSSQFSRNPVAAGFTSGRDTLSQLSQPSQSHPSTPHDGHTLIENEGHAGATATTATATTEGYEEILLPRIRPERKATIEEARQILVAWKTGDYSLSAISDSVYNGRNKRQIDLIRGAISLASSSLNDSKGSSNDDTTDDMTKDLAISILSSDNMEHPRRSEALVFLQGDVKIAGKGWNEKGKPKSA